MPVDKFRTQKGAASRKEAAPIFWLPGNYRDARVLLQS